MPSLNALGEFKFSFHNIANEKNDVMSKKLPFDDLPLPETEAAPMEMPSRSSSSDEDFQGEDGGGESGFDFSAFLNTLPVDAEPPPLDSTIPFDDPPSIDDIFQEAAPSSDQSSLDDFLGGFSPTPSEEASADSLDGLLSGSDDTGTGDFGLGDIDKEDASTGDFGLGDFGTEDAGTGDFGQGDFGTEDAGAGDFGLGDLGTGDSGAGDFGLGDLGTEDTGAGDFGLGDFGTEDADAIDLGGEAIDLGGESPGVDFGGGSFDSPQDDGVQDSGEVEAPSDDFDLGGEAIDLGGESVDFPPMQDETPPVDDSAMSDDFSGGFDLPSPASDDFDMGGIDLGGESIEESPLPDMSSPQESESDFDDLLSQGTGSDFDSSLPDTDFGDMGLGEPPQDDSGFDMGGESGFEDTGAAPFDLGSDFASDSIELGSGPDPLGLETSGGDFGSGDFSGSSGGDEFDLPGLEDLFEKTKTTEVRLPEQKKGFFQRRKDKRAAEELPEAEESIEEIRLTQDELDKLLATLAAYPLNLRIVCEEMIAEQVLLPQQLSKLIRLLVNGAHVRETAALAEEITGKAIVIPKSFEKMTGAAFEAEQSSFAYIFVHNFLPVLRLFAIIAAFLASLVYLGYRFVYIPVKAENIYKRGYERISAGEYQRANQLFNEAFATHRKKKWFYTYAEGFRDQRRYLLAEEKYDELLYNYPRDKKGVLDYAHLNTYYLLNYDKANRLLQQQLLDYSPNDYDGLLAAGDNFLLWADSDPSRFYDRYEDARFSYARLLELRGWQVPIVERMLRYFIRTDNLREVLYLRVWFENDDRRRLSPSSLADLGGYLLDKQLEEVKGVPDVYLESIESVRDMLLQAVREEPTLPEPHYHLARYYHSLGNTYEERLTLENSIRAFDLAQTESVRRRLYRVDTHYRYANLLINNREFFPAEEQLNRGIQLFEDFLSRNLIRATTQLGQLYAGKGDLEYFVKIGDMRAALNYYRNAERYGYAPPEIQYRMGTAYYQLEDWGNAQDYLFKASAELPLNRRLLYALGNVTYQRGNYFAAQGYYSRLLDILENQRIRLPVLLPNDNPQFLELGERLMMARNNAGVVYEALADQTGNREYRSTAMALYAESARAWDSITRNPETMTRMRLTDSPGAPGINLGYLNANNALRPSSNYRPQIFPRIDKDVLEPSRWEELAPFGGLQ